MLKLKNKGINKLRSLTLILTSINFSLKDLSGFEGMPLYRVEISLDNVVLDQTSDIIASVSKKDKSLTLSLGSADFKYAVSDLFSLHKVARLIVKVMRSSLLSDQEQLLDQYQVILSQYSYQYSDQKKIVMNQHSIGLFKTSFLYYSIHCTYRKMMNKQNQILGKIPMLKRNTYNISQSQSSNGFSPLLKRDNGVLPIDSIQRDIQVVSEDESQQTYISKNKLKPIYHYDPKTDTKIKIILERSYINIEQTMFTQQSSLIEERKTISSGLGSITNIMFIIYMILALGRIWFLMVPSPKVW